jgi:ABC-type sugar transport system substrate-binding protein
MRRLRPTAVAAACVALMAVAVGCGASNDDSNSSSSGGGKQLTVGFSMPDSSESFWVSMAYGVQQEAKKLGVKVVKASAGGDANANQQISQIQDLMQRGVDGLVVGATDANAVTPVVNQAIAQGIPVVGASSLPNSKKLTSSVFTDNVGMGTIEAKCLGNAIGGKGSVAMLVGPAGQIWADLRAKGFKDTLKKEFPNVKVVASTRLADNRNAALTTTQNWLQRFPALNGIYSVTDDTGAGAVDAIQAAHKAGQVKVSASNFSPAARQLLQKGLFTCTAAQQIVTQGEQALLQAVNAAKKQPVKATVVTPVVKLTKQNVAQTNLAKLQAPAGFTP